MKSYPLESADFRRLLKSIHLLCVIAPSVAAIVVAKELLSASASTGPAPDAGWTPFETFCVAVATLYGLSRVWFHGLVPIVRCVEQRMLDVDWRRLLLNVGANAVAPALLAGLVGAAWFALAEGRALESGSLTFWTAVLAAGLGLKAFEWAIEVCYQRLARELGRDPS